MSAAAIQDFRRIWRVTTIQRDERTMMLMNWLALAGASLGLIGAGLAMLSHKAGPLELLRVLFGVTGFWLGVIWMTLFVPGSILLNSPANARLLPRQRRRLQQMVVGSWVLVTVMVVGDYETVLRQAALCVLAGQVAMTGLLGDFAGEGGWNVPLALQSGLLAVFELAVALGLAKASGTGIWAWVAAIAVAAGAWQLRRGWRTMLAAPPAFPAGRIG